MSVPHARGFLLLRRGGGLWGIANAAVDGLARHGVDYRITIGGNGGGDLVADEILGVVEDLRVWPLAPAVSRFWPEAAAGLALHGREPVVVVDPGRPPAALSAEGSEEGDRPDDEERE
ncbi:MAG TPA: hypothetical protein VLV54_03780 [Thermoanaerobaculia bacterium]|nr:hypothetical protein [Thermoanaerobaculia bacterium]